MGLCRVMWIYMPSQLVSNSYFDKVQLAQELELFKQLAVMTSDL